MKKRNILFFISSLILMIGLASCGLSNNTAKNDNKVENDNNAVVDNDEQKNDNVIITEPTGDFNDGVILLKSNSLTSNDLGDLKYKSYEQLFRGSSWYRVILNDGVDTIESVKYLASLNKFENIDYDYVLKQNDNIDLESYDGRITNPGYINQYYFKQLGIDKMYQYMEKYSPVDNNGKKITGAGGNKSTVIAVVDTGVDYNHPDLRENMWVNNLEIPNNNVDDDGNGYVDDYYGWNCIAHNGDPQDDQGHGTHCAGIIGAANNNIGGVGIAYNCKIMAVKCGDASGTFNSSDIAEAVTYAYMNGADVISMSIGGTDLSIAVQEALEKAYNSTLICAAAGNDGMKNEPAYPGDLLYKPVYPACYPYVMGVMACDSYNNYAFFTNWDTNHDNQIEYEIAAPGIGIYSTIPNNKYAAWNGTSMSTPIVAAIGGLLRSYFPDKETYTTKFLMSQLSETASYFGGEKYPGVVNAYAALTEAPKPNLSLYDYYIFDNVELSDKNDGDGIADAGETIHIGVALRNKGGVASNIHLEISNVMINGIADKYVELVSNGLDIENVGTYSIREPNKIKDENGKIVDVSDYFTVKIKDDVPNSYPIVLTLTGNYKNGLNQNDNTSYDFLNNGEQYKIRIVASNGIKLPCFITEDTTFESGQKYIMVENLVIDNDVTCVFEEGCVIELYGNIDGYYNTLFNSLKITSYGNLIFNGTEDNPIIIKANREFGFEEIPCFINSYGSIVFNYCDITNVRTGENSLNTIFRNSIIRTNGCHYNLVNGQYNGESSYISADIIENCQIVGRDLSHIFRINVNSFIGNSMSLLKSKPSEYPYPNLYYLEVYNECSNNIFIQQKEFDLVAGSNGDYDPLTITLKGTVTRVDNNVFMNSYDENELPFGKSMRIIVEDGCVDDWNGNEFYGIYGLFVNKFVYDHTVGTGNVVVKYHPDVNNNPELRQVHIKSIKIYDMDDNEVTKIDKKEYKYVVTFNKEMDTSKELNVLFGSRRPYADFKVNGEWIDEYTWSGTYTMKSIIENGIEHFYVFNAYAKDDSFFESQDYGRYISFEVEVLGSLSMNLSAIPSIDGVELTWVQDDYDTLMGYNVYRSESKDGNYVKLNTVVIPSDENLFLDENAEPGKTYWYTFTVVFTDLSESIPSGKTYAIAFDTEAPRIYHTPVNQGYLNNNLVISCTATDNISIKTALLYYRIVGDNEYKFVTMNNSNNRYRGVILANELDLMGIEYYIEISDGFNSITKGTEETPYSVVIKDSSALMNIGDVDGDGIITTKDALMIIKAINGDLILTDDQFKRADLNKDNTLSSVEALRILQYINGNVITLEM